MILLNVATTSSGSHPLSIREGGVLAQLKRIGGAVIRGFGHLEGQIACKIGWRPRIIRIDPNQHTVEGSNGVN